MKLKHLLYTFAFFSIISTACAEEKQAAEPLFRDGKGFFTYKRAFEDKVNGKLKLVSFFHYGCEPCVAADDYLKLYAERYPDKVVLERYPYFNEGKTFTARMHATFSEYGRPELSALYLFDSAGRKGEASLVDNEAAVEKWLVNHNVELHAFKALFNSEKVSQKVQEYIQISKKYVPPVSPFVSINGKYVLVQSTLYNDDYTYAVLDFLYEKEQENK